MRKQSQEELEHAYDLADYVSKRGGVAKVDKIDVVPQEWESVLDAFENVYKHECHVSSLIEDTLHCGQSNFLIVQIVYPIDTEYTKKEPRKKQFFQSSFFNHL